MGTTVYSEGNRVTIRNGEDPRFTIYFNSDAVNLVRWTGQDKKNYLTIPKDIAKEIGKVLAERRL